MIGSFERLGILVIVVIIVMILAIAIYQWGGAGLDAGGYAAASTEAPADAPLERELGELALDDRPLAIEPGPGTPPPSPGVPAEYVIQRNDNLWTLVRRWGLKDSFIESIKRANPQLDVRNLMPGQKIRIPSTEGAATATPPQDPAGSRSYQVQEGDDLSTIARTHLGSSRRYREILRLNPGLNARRLKIGQTILIPAK